MIHIRSYPLQAFVGVVLTILSGILPGFAQRAKQELPLVIAGKMPLYPLTALHVGVQGVVKIKVTTDGKKVTSLEAESGPAMLVKFAKENILTWEFTEHKPSKFVTTFEYVIETPAECEFSNNVSVLRLPLEIHVSAKGLKTCDPATETKPHQ